MTSVSVLMPWACGCRWREKAQQWVLARYAEHHPDWEVVIGHSSAEGFSRTQAILDAASRATGDVLVVTDADAWCDPGAAIGAAQRSGWSIPHRFVHRLSPDSTLRVVDDGEDWRGLPLSRDNAQDHRPYLGNECATLVVLTRDAFDAAPPDPRFVGWGQEDDAWALALRSLVGPPERLRGDLVHLWHPPQQRKSRIVGSGANLALLRRYQQAGRRGEMAALVEEARSCAV